MKLEELLQGVATKRVHGDLTTDVRALTYDSRRVRPGDVFVALRGVAADGHAFLQKAFEAGAAAGIVEADECFEALRGVRGRTIVLAEDTRRALARAAANFYGNPSAHFTLVGITGTNGKTTTSYLVESILREAGFHPGVVGTVNYRLGAKEWPASHTTPESLELQRLLSEMRDSGAKSVVMEVSSHALVQCRVHASEFDAVAFTNLTQDHLDFHKDMEDYFAAKNLLFTEQLREQRIKRDTACVVNVDDPYGRRLFAECHAAGRRTVSYGLAPVGRDEGRGDLPAAVFPLELSWDSAGMRARVRTPLGELPVRSPLIGEHNVSNILCAVAVGCALALPLEAIASGIENLESVPGRLEPVTNDLGILVLVDYAHTPNALRNVLAAVRSLTKGRVLCVFGCGGDRDRAKRPLMAQAVMDLADLPILTSDNPRTEDPGRILADARVGLSGEEGKDFFVEPDRRSAIALAMARAREGDVVLIAGKGHEDYQIIGTEKFPFDDRFEAAQALRRLEATQGRKA